MSSANFYFTGFNKEKEAVFIMQINLSMNPYPMRKSVRMIGEFNDYFIRKGVQRIHNTALRTESINSCTAGVLQGQDKCFMFHAAPELQPLAMIKKDILRCTEMLKETCGNIKGFICGGWAPDIKDKSAMQSFDLYNCIADTFDELGINFTMMCGKPKGAPMDNLCAVSKKIFVWSDAFKEMFTKENLQNSSAADILKRYYQVTENLENQEINIFSV